MDPIGRAHRQGVEYDRSMHSTFSASNRLRIEIRRGSEPAIGFDVAPSEVGSLSALALASARAMGFSTFVAFNRLQRSPELWAAIALASLRLALSPMVDQAAVDRLRAGLAAAWSRLSPPPAPASTPSS